MGTIVQEYGPIYGEVINGTVSGRPNGSIYIPPVNTVSLTLDEGYIIWNGLNGYAACKSNGTVAVGSVHIRAEAQDVSSSVRYAVFSDSACTTMVGKEGTPGAGNFNMNITTVGSDTSNQLVTGQKYYVRLQLYNSGSPIATSNVVEVEAA